MAFAVYDDIIQWLAFSAGKHIWGAGLSALPKLARGAVGAAFPAIRRRQKHCWMEWLTSSPAQNFSVPACHTCAMLAHCSLRAGLVAFPAVGGVGLHVYAVFPAKLLRGASLRAGGLTVGAIVGLTVGAVGLAIGAIVGGARLV